MIVVAFGLILIQLFRNHYFNQTLAFYSLDDYYYYGYTADNMFQKSVEGINFNIPLLGDVSRYRVPYHYFDLWTNSFFHFIIPGNSIHVYLFVFVPFTCFLIFLGLLSVYEAFNNKIGPLALLICFLLTFYFGIMPFSNGQLFPNVMLQPRTFVSFWISSLAIIYFKESRYLVSMVIICSLPLMNIMAAPGVLTAVFLFGGYSYWKSRKTFWLQSLIVSIAIFLFIIIFYWGFGNPFTNASSGIITMKQYVKQVVHVLFVDTLIRSCFFYLPFILFLIGNFGIVKKAYAQNRQLYNFFMLMFLLTLVFSALASFNLEGSTMMFFPASALISVLATIATAKYIRDELLSTRTRFLGTTTAALFFLQLILCFYATLSPRFDYNRKPVSKLFIDEMNSVIRPNSNIGYMLDTNYLKNNKWSDNPFLCRKLHFIGLINKKINLFNLSAPIDSLKISTSMLNPDFIKSGDLYRFFDKSDKDTSERSSLYDSFIVKNRINFILLDSGVIFNTHIPGKYQVVSDTSSGFKLIILSK